MKIKRDKADALFSLYIRTRDKWTCQRCGRYHRPPTRALHCAHHFGRWKESTRFDPDNCDALCHGCHSYFTANPREYVIWKEKRLGPSRYACLEVAASDYKKKDRKMELIKIKALMEEL